MAFIKVSLTATVDTIKEAWTKFNNLIDDLLSVSSGKGASQIGIYDSAGNMDAANVEDALAEIYDVHSSARTEIGAFDEDSDLVSGLTWGHASGRIRSDNVVTSVAAGTIALTDDATNYVELKADGTLTRNTAGFTAGRIPLREVVCASGVQTTSTDKRAWFVADMASVSIGSYGGDFDAAITAIDDTETTLYVGSAATMSAAVTVPATCAVIVQKGGSIDQGGNALTFNGPLIFQGGTIDNDAALTMNGPVAAGGYKLFTNTTGVSFGKGAIEKGNVRWWGALGDDTNDDTAEIQAAIVACLSTTGGRLYFPDGTYKITSALTILQYDGFVIQGQSQGGTFIKQYTSNTPIFHFTKKLTHSFEISDLYLEYNVQQTSTESDSIAFYIDPDTTGGAYNFTIKKCNFKNVFKGISLNDASTGVSMWGATFEKLWYNNTCTGSIIDVYTTVSYGRPNINCNQIYIDATSTENAQPLLRFQGTDNLVVNNIEVNNNDNGATVLMLEDGVSAVIGSIKVEGATYETTADTFFTFDNTVASVELLRLSTATINIPGGYFAFLKAAGTLNRLDIRNLDIAGCTFTAGDAWILYGAATTQNIVIGAIPHIGSFALTDISATAQASTIYIEDWNRPLISADNGDADLTISVGDEQVQMFETQLTADRTVTLPEHEANPTNVFHGLTYKIVRNAGTPGTFTLTVKDNDAVTIGTIANDKNGAITVMYRRKDWELIGDEEW